MAQNNPNFLSFYEQHKDIIPEIDLVPAQLIEDVFTLAKTDFVMGAKITTYAENAKKAASFTLSSLPEVGVLISILFLMNTHIKIYKNADGKWEFLVEHKGMSDNLLAEIAKILTNIFQ